MSKIANTLLEWTACIITIAGAAATALGHDPLNIWLLNAGAVLYLVWAARVRILSLVLINLALLTIYIYGAILRLL